MMKHKWDLQLFAEGGGEGGAPASQAEGGSAPAAPAVEEPALRRRKSARCAAVAS